MPFIARINSTKSKFQEKKFVYFHLKRSLVYLSHKHMQKVSLVLVKAKYNNNVNQQQYDAH